MMKQNWVMRVRRGLVLVASGSMVLGSSCASDIRESLQSAGLDFVQSSAEIVLEALFPIDERLNPE